MQKIIYKSYYDMVLDVKDFCKKINISGVAGVPRSGCLIASIIAQELNIPLYFINDKELINYRLDISRPINKCHNKILIIDDTSWSGRAMSIIKDNLKDYNNLIYGAMYCSEQQSKFLDVYFEIFYTPTHTFEWNFLKDYLAQSYFTDFDGVLCEDPNCLDDTPEYISFLNKAKAKYIPKYKLGAIVTARLEKYRSETEKWLRVNKIDYHDLIMSPYKTSEERLRMYGFGTWKANIYKTAPDHIKLFVESNAQQAEEIFVISKRPVFCTDEMRLYQ